MKEDHISDEQSLAILDAITVLEVACGPASTVLSPEDKQKYGSVSEQNKLIVNKAMSLKKDFPDKTCPDVNWEEFDADFKSREQIEEMILRLDQIMDLLRGSKILYDYDNYQAALKDYRYSKYKNDSQEIGYSVKVDQYKQFFAVAKKSDSSNKAKNTNKSTEEATE